MRYKYKCSISEFKAGISPLALKRLSRNFVNVMYTLLQIRPTDVRIHVYIIMSRARARLGALKRKRRVADAATAELIYHSLEAQAVSVTQILVAIHTHRPRPHEILSHFQVTGRLLPRVRRMVLSNPLIVFGPGR